VPCGSAIGASFPISWLERRSKSSWHPLDTTRHEPIAPRPRKRSGGSDFMWGLFYLSNGFELRRLDSDHRWLFQHLHHLTLLANRAASRPGLSEVEGSLPANGQAAI
jgi:hypothetical protein